VGVNQSGFAVSSADGRKLWQQDFGNQVVGAPAASDSTVYFTCRSHWITAMSTNGKVEWATYFNGDITAAPTISKDGIVYVVGYGYLKAFDPTNAAPPANSPWPLFRANARHTGHVGSVETLNR
jgi:outer membrane protein assembly factor BamB